MKNARDRFDDIVTVLEARGVNLETTLTNSERYQVSYNDLITWLDSAEDIQSRWQSPGKDLDTVRRQYLEHRVGNIFVVAKSLHLRFEATEVVHVYFLQNLGPLFRLSSLLRQIDLLIELYFSNVS